jgi:predicted nucleotidyltransferase
MAQKNNIRLLEKEIETIKEVIKKYDPNAKIKIFGSRTDLSKKGGDIDILVISKKIGNKIRRKLKSELFLKFGDRKMDLLITDNPDKTEFSKIAFKYGVEI